MVDTAAPAAAPDDDDDDGSDDEIAGSYVGEVGREEEAGEKAVDGGESTETRADMGTCKEEEGSENGRGRGRGRERGEVLVGERVALLLLLLVLLCCC